MFSQRQSVPAPRNSRRGGRCQGSRARSEGWPGAGRTPGSTLAGGWPAPARSAFQPWTEGAPRNHASLCLSFAPGSSGQSMWRAAGGCRGRLEVPPTKALGQLGAACPSFAAELGREASWCALPLPSQPRPRQQRTRVGARLRGKQRESPGGRQQVAQVIM